MSGKNAIDIAFEVNSIFSIKLFVNRLLELDDQEKFKNCFDKALILMIAKKMNVNQLLNSNLLYPPIWENLTVFSDKIEKTFCGYNGTIENLLKEDPNILFYEDDSDQELED